MKFRQDESSSVCTFSGSIGSHFGIHQHAFLSRPAAGAATSNDGVGKTVSVCDRLSSLSGRYAVANVQFNVR